MSDQHLNFAYAIHGHHVIYHLSIEKEVHKRYINIGNNYHDYGSELGLGIVLLNMGNTYVIKP